MAQWQRTLYISDAWNKAQAHEIAPQKLAKIIAEKLHALPVFNIEHIDDQLDELVDIFLTFSEEEEVDAEDFDDIMSDLYDWADIPLDDKSGGKKVCWIKTF